MRSPEYIRPRSRLAVLAATFVLLSLCLSCASVVPGLSRPARERGTVLAVPHARSAKPSDCLAVCTNMVLQYYGVEPIAPDTAMPLNLISLSHRLNTGEPVDAEGHTVFATVIEFTPAELAAQLEKRRPVIVAFKPSARKAYHSVVLSGHWPERGRVYVHDPAKRKPAWKKLSKLPTYESSGKYLVLLIGLREA